MANEPIFVPEFSQPINVNGGLTGDGTLGSPLTANADGVSIGIVGGALQVIGPSQTPVAANLILAGPLFGNPDAAPTFRALEVADLPGGAWGNPFDQSLNKADAVEFLSAKLGGLAIGLDTPIEADIINFGIGDPTATYIFRQGAGATIYLFEQTTTPISISALWSDATNPNDNYANLLIDGYTQGANTSQFYLQRSTRQNAIISLVGDGQDNGVALFDLFNPILGGGAYDTQVFQVQLNSGGDILLDLYADGSDLAHNRFSLLNGAMTVAGIDGASGTTGAAALSSSITTGDGGNSSDALADGAAGGDFTITLGAGGTGGAGGANGRSGLFITSALPTSDPGVSGAYYKVAGAVYQSA